MGDPYSILNPGATVKMYPCGSLGQPSMDTLLVIINLYYFNNSKIKEIRVGLK